MAATIIAPLLLLELSFVSDFRISASDLRPALVMGMVYGLAGAWCWTLTLIERKISRFLVGAAIVTSLSFFSAAEFERPLLRYWVNLSGMMLVQTVLFWLVRLPRWRSSRAETTVSKRQFQILDILLVTTGLALLLTVAGCYQTPVAGEDYWPVMVVIWIGFPVLAACVCFAVIDARWLAGVCWSVAAVLLGCGGGFALAALDQNLTRDGFQRLAAQYVVITLAYAVVWWTFGWAARQDAIVKSRFRQEVAPAGES